MSLSTCSENLSLFCQRLSDNVGSQWRPFYWILLSVLPLVFITLMMPSFMASIGMLLTLPLLYRLTKAPAYRMQLFEFDYTCAHWYVIVPVECLIIVWSFLLVLMDKSKLVMPIIGVLSFQLIIVISPVLRYRLTRKTSRLSYAMSFWSIGGLITVLQGFYLFHSFIATI